MGNPAAFAESVVALARALGARYVIPIGEPALLALLPRRGELPPGAIPWPSLDTVRNICDKRLVLEAAPAEGISVPRQVVLADRSSLRDELPLTWPVVAKPSRSVAGASGAWQKLRVRHAANAAELRLVVDQLPDAAFPLLLQERVVGPGIGIFLLIWDGVVRAAFAHRRIREKPPAGGVSVYREAIAADPGLVEKSRALLARFGWNGVAMVEYKLDERTGVPALMEINGRFWGSLQLRDRCWRGLSPAPPRVRRRRHGATTHLPRGYSAPVVVGRRGSPAGAPSSFARSAGPSTGLARPDRCRRAIPSRPWCRPGRDSPCG